MKRRTCCILLAVPFLSAPAAATFVTETVVNESVSATAIAMDPSGDPRVAYFVGHPVYHLKYAERLGGVWSTETADSNGVFGSGVDLALDSAGTPHISYATNGPGYATRSGGIWNVQQIEAVSVSSGTSIAVDALGRPHVAYAGSTVGLRHAVLDGGTWQITVVDPVASWGPSLALDAQGRARIGYAYSSGPLRYAEETASGWDLTAVDETPGAFFDGPSLALDSQGNPHLSYLANSPDFDLRHSTKAAGPWIHTSVDTAGFVGWYNSVAVNAGDEPRIAYTGAGNNLVFASRSGSAWTLETVDPLGGTGDYISLVLDSADRPHISYRDFPGQRIAYATVSVPTSAASSSARPRAFRVHGAFPNPGHAEGAVRFALPRADVVRLAVHDVSGRRLLATDAASLNRGEHVLTWDGADLPAGVYYVRLTTASGDAGHARWVKLR